MAPAMPLRPSCIFVSISGGQAAGKKTVQAAIARRLTELSGGRLRIVCLHMGDFTRPLDDAARRDAVGGVKDMDAIDAYDLDLLATTIQSVLAADTDISTPRYDVLSFTHAPTTDPIAPTNSRGETGPADVLLVEGCYMLSEKRLVEMADIKVFVDLNADARLGRRVVRDTEERGIPLDKVFDRYLRFGKRAFEGRMEPAKSRADIILPKGAESAAIDLIALGIWDDINARADASADERTAKASLVERTSLGAPKTISIGDVDLERFYDPI
ncbi:Uridine-cytidine kinase [Drechslerella dactyloides]|uniref:Uridine-cytidine kinase n=1 Tax=Drechslerella dactyloides TaxID=74499 RepID=A0AAD6ISU1_DREDA|nr:Uridine-cytidine kinase [Drechslerella dactyloides]